MMRSLFSGVSGLKNHQTRMDVIGNNIANVNTTAFKASRVVFSDIYSQTVNSASSPTANTGGTNPTQIGLGVTLASIDVMHTSGASGRTDNTSDLAIEGDGYFVIQNTDGSYMYTRTGNFLVDNDGNLVTTSGLKVMGMMGSSGQVTDSDGRAVYEYERDSSGSIVYDIYIKTYDTTGTDELNPPRAAVAADKEYANKYGLTYYVKTSDIPGSTATTEYTEVTATAGATKVTTDDLSKPLFVKVTDTTVTPNTVSYLSKTAVDAHNADIEAGDTTNLIAGYTTKIEFSVNDLVVNRGTAGTPDYQPASGVTVNNDYEQITVPLYIQDYTLTPRESNVLATGWIPTEDFTFEGVSGKMNPELLVGINLSGFTSISFGQDGTISGLDANGNLCVIGSVALAVFDNPSGLDKMGTSNYIQSMNSGEPTFTLGQNNGAGKLNSGALEMSNVDIATEFTDMIVTQRGYQANSRIITVSDSMLEELVNLKR